MRFHNYRINIKHLSLAIVPCLLMSISFIATQSLAQMDAAGKVKAAENEAQIAQKNAEAKVRAAEEARMVEAKAAAKARAAELEAREAQSIAAEKAKIVEKARMAQIIAERNSPSFDKARTDEEALAAKVQAAQAAQIEQAKAVAQAKAQEAEAAKMAAEKAAAMKAAEAAVLAKAQEAEAAKMAAEKAAAMKAAEAAVLAKAQEAEAAKMAAEKAAEAVKIAKARETAIMAQEKAAAKKTAATKSVAKTVATPKKADSRDLSNVIGSKECGECHKSEVFTWKDTHHSTTFNLLPRKKNTKAISKKMGIRSVKRDSDCLTCHFTSQIIDKKEKAISGIACESCHGPAKKWIKIHGDYGGKKVTKEMETPEHKADRFAKIEAANMIRPNDLYRVAENCYQCHTVPNEKLVNVGGHKAGSDFELVSWSQGEVRHNFLHSSDKGNRQASQERKRLMFIVGRALHLEYSLRGVSQSTEKAKYAVTMAKRVVKIKKDLAAIQKVVNVPEIANMLSIAKSVKLKLNNEAALLVAADKVAEEAKKLAKTYTGKEWKGLDKYIPKKFKGKAGVAPPPGQ